MNAGAQAPLALSHELGETNLGGRLYEKRQSVLLEHASGGLSQQAANGFLHARSVLTCSDEIEARELEANPVEIGTLAVLSAQASDSLRVDGNRPARQQVGPSRQPVFEQSRS